MKKSIYWSVAAVSLICAAPLTTAAALTLKEDLGKAMYEDTAFSYNDKQSCKTCHSADAGFADPTNAVDPENIAVSTGADGESTGDRNAPTSSYCGYSPILHYDTKRGEYVGGMFWDGRATGEILNDPLAEQAQGPPLNPVEMAMESVEAIVEVIRNDYVGRFEAVYGEGSLDDDNADTDDAEWMIYDLMGDAIAAYERSSEVQRFSSRYDTGELSEEQEYGLDLFKNHCNRCHKIQYTVPHTGEKVDLFTSYSYANIGIPTNPEVRDEPDLGLGYTISNRKQRGKFKIPTLRNVALTAPYGHNGYFATLEDIVSFKNDSTSYPEPDVDENISPFIGDMGMSDTEVSAVVEFLRALSDQ